MTKLSFSRVSCIVDVKFKHWDRRHISVSCHAVVSGAKGVLGFLWGQFDPNNIKYFPSRMAVSK